MQHHSYTSRFALLFALVSCLAAAPPSLRVIRPLAHSSTSDAVLTVSGVAAAATRIDNIYWKDQLGGDGKAQWTPAASAPNSLIQWTAQVPLRPGSNRITVVVVDSENNSASVPLNVRREVGFGPQPSEIRAGFWHGVPVTFAEVEGWGIVEGDIVLGPAGKLQTAPGPRDGPIPYGLTDGYTNLIWPLVGSVHPIPYTIQNGSANVSSALTYVNSVLTGVIQFVPQTTEANYVTFNLDSNNHSGSCQSSVGMVGGQQFVSGSIDCAVSTLAHEMGHTLGLLHEHQRPDRNSFVTFTPANADKPLIAGNLDLPTTNFQTVGLYDYASLMHYGAFTFSKNGLTVLESLPAGIPLSNSTGYSVGDLDTIQRLYGSSPATVTVTTNPAGLKVVVDGATYTAPHTFTWTLNSSHTINLPNDPQLTNPNDGSTYRFARWNDGGAKSHTIGIGGGSGELTSPANRPAVTLYEANYIRLQPFALSVTPAGTGTASVSPPPQAIFGGSFFVDRHQVSLAAAPNAGEHFYGWFGPPYPQGANPYPFLIQAPLTNVQAAFTNMPVTAIGESITGPNTWNPPLYAFVDGIFTDLPQGYSQDRSGTGWAPGTTHSLSAPSPAVPITTNVGYNWNNWSDSGAQTHNITASSSGVSTIVGSFTPVYRSYAFPFESCGTVTYSQSCPNNDCSFADGTSLTMTATPNAGSGMVFAGWTGDLTGLTNPAPVTIHDEFLPVANFNIVPTILTVTSISPATPVTTPNAMDLTINGTGFVNGSFFGYWNNGFRNSTVVSSTRATLHLNAGDLSAAGGQLVQASNFTSACGAYALGSVLVKATSGSPVLYVAKHHTGNFTKGQLGAKYTVTVSSLKSSTGPTTGKVSVVDTIPAGLTLISMAGTGWSCAGKTCTRSDVLNPLQSYPAITVTVNVAGNAPASVTNVATVLGGNAPSYNSFDPTTIQ